MPGEPSDELFDLVDEDGQVVGSALRQQVHGNPSLLHPVIHCVVLNSRGELLLQLRALSKTVQPGKWDLSVGGHVASGEPVEAALAREMAEEIGVDAEAARPRFLYRYVWRNDFESELVSTFGCSWDGAVQRQEDEIDELRFFTRTELETEVGSGRLTPNLEDELRRLAEHGYFG